MGKSEQLQIRVSKSQKAELSRRARASGMSLSAWVLERALPSKASAFQQMVRSLSVASDPSFVLASINDFLAKLTSDELPSALEAGPSAKLSRLLRTYLAAMVEHTAARKGVAVPRWALETPPLEQPYFASQLQSLRLHLLTSSPSAFRRRNLFVDASVGDRA